MLYNKYRPSSLKEIIGNKNIVYFIENAIKNKSLPHSMLFCGDHGVGKTSIARIVAKNLKCQEIDKKEYDSSDCECNSCKLISKSIHPDVIEVDAASNSKIDNTKQIIDSTAYVATDLKNKIYIIDEAHMLSNASFNVLLKTIEEPRSNIYFILVTTEMYKIPNTIISRCVCLDFQKASIKDLQSKIEYICKEENIKYDDESILQISYYANGSVRDAVSMLEHISIASNKNITLSLVENVLQIPDSIIIDKIINDIIYGNTNDAISRIHQMKSNNKAKMLAILDSIYIKIKKSISSNDSDQSVHLSQLIRIWEIIKDTYIAGKHIENSSMILDMSIILSSLSSKFPSVIDIIDNIKIDTNEKIASSILDNFNNASINKNT